MKLFGKGGLIDFSLPMSAEEAQAKIERYGDLYREVWDGPEPQTEEEWEVWTQKMREEHDLFHELREEVAGFEVSLEDELEDELEEEEASRGGGLFGWLFG